ncbi:hypothetical protein CBR_g9104 [Chara braunii]|uniref:Uncharacterized protein n=1 Tax=Chara braunii TaxID=69332 RepID=A0A388KNR3_CHABU|nr:hypothetical protein CBR_g9104 [Chara braunii]|eukprot:GBG71691.1 hypothetical protein CBR_g9104 [Chara braunii]
MLGFSDLAVLAGAWDRGRHEFDDESEVLCEKLELRKQEYVRECRELGGRSAKVKQIFLKIWDVDDSQLEGRVLETRTGDPVVTQDNHVTLCDDLAIEEEERIEMERAIAAIKATTQDSPPASGKKGGEASERDQYTAFVPLASMYWVEHTSTAFRHAIWKMDTFNHLAPISVRALQFLGNVTDEQVRQCKTMILKGKPKYCGRANPLDPQDLKFPPMHELDPDKCGETNSAQDRNGWVNAPGQMTTLPNGRKAWRRQKSECDTFLHLKYTSRVMEPLSIRRLINGVLSRVIGDDTATWLERTRIGWTYKHSKASRLCRPAETFCDFNVSQWMEGYDPEQYPCRTRRYSDMRSSWSIELLHNEGCTHVITLDSSITDSPLLQNIINADLNHIPCMALDVDEAIAELGSFLDELFARVMELRDLTDSTKSFLRRIILKKGKEKMEKYRVTHRHVAAEPFEHPTVKSELTFLTSRFLICPTDKAPNTPAFVCKNFIRKLAFQRLSDPEFASISAPPATVISCIRGELSALPTIPAATALLPYLMAVLKAHKGTFRWITNTANTIISPAAEVCACLLRFLLPLVQAFCQDKSLEVEQHGVKPNLWWAISSVGEFYANLPEKVYSVFTTDITRCFETIPTDNSEDSLTVAVRFYVQCAMQVRRERSSSHAIRIRFGGGGDLQPSWADAGQPEEMGTLLFRKGDIYWLSKWCIANNCAWENKCGGR